MAESGKQSEESDSLQSIAEAAIELWEEFSESTEADGTPFVKSLCSCSFGYPDNPPIECSLCRLGRLVKSHKGSQA